MLKIVIAVILLIAAGLFGAGYVLSVRPEVQIANSVDTLGSETPVQVEIESPHGVRRVTAWVEQAGKRHQVFESTADVQRMPLFREKQPPKQISFAAGTTRAAELKDGPAKLIVEAAANDFAAKTATAEREIQINTQPPVVSADGHQHYINQGGSELVTFTVSGYWTDAGVRVGNYTFRSFPLPGKGENERFSIFAFPWDVLADTVPVVYASNPAGAEVTARFWTKVFPKQFRSRDLKLDDRFLQKVLGELDPNGSGNLADRFLKVNRDMRIRNNETLSNLRFKTEPAVLWNGPFYRLGKVESFFADRRTYFYQGNRIDQQMHLGFDLSDVQASPVKAANAGRVVFAEALGIYGNCVVIDHGYGLQSIYGHMRQIDVKPGEMVQKEQVLGRSGETGLAGGDHLHFSMQVDGVQVNPLEWWDSHWIQDRILSKLPAGTAHGSTAP